MVIFGPLGSQILTTLWVYYDHKVKSNLVTAFEPLNDRFLTTLRRCTTKGTIGDYLWIILRLIGNCVVWNN